MTFHIALVFICNVIRENCILICLSIFLSNILIFWTNSQEWKKIVNIRFKLRDSFFVALKKFMGKFDFWIKPRDWRNCIHDRVFSLNLQTDFFFFLFLTIRLRNVCKIVSHWKNWVVRRFLILYELDIYLKILGQFLFRCYTGSRKFLEFFMWASYIFFNF